jgi:hypothetical protein
MLDKRIKEYFRGREEPTQTRVAAGNKGTHLKGEGASQ